MRISFTSIPFRFFIIFTACLCIYFAIQKKKSNENEEILSISSRFEIRSSKYTSILGPKLDKLPNQDDVIQLFQLWKKEHGRVYSDLEEMAKKLDIFVSNLKYITETNAKRDSPHSSLLGLTNFADLSFMEFKERYMSMNTDTMDIVKDDDVDEVTCSKPPSKLDWRLKGAVTPIKNQGSCGCCWAFSTVAAIEGIVATKTKKLIPLSEQELLDCEPYGNCLRGNVNKALIWVEENKGVATQDHYPYTAKKDVCRNTTIPNSATSRIKSHHLVKRSENGLLCSVAKQPLNVGIYAETREFQHYTGGVFRGQQCPLDSMNITHSMVIVGYDSVDSDKYWIVKNSVGTKWGKNGYMFIKRETGKKYGVCAIDAWAIEIVKNK